MYNVCMCIYVSYSSPFTSIACLFSLLSMVCTYTIECWTPAWSAIPTTSPLAPPRSSYRYSVLKLIFNVVIAQYTLHMGSIVVYICCCIIYGSMYVVLYFIATIHVILTYIHTFLYTFTAHYYTYTYTSLTTITILHLLYILHTAPTMHYVYTHMTGL